MSNFGKRLAEERKRLGFNQEVMAAHGGVKKQAQSLYESGKRKPDSEYLTLVAEAGVDVSYVITGVASQPEPSLSLSPDQQMLLDAYNELPVNQQKALLASLLMGNAPAEKQEAKKSESKKTSNSVSDNKNSHFNINGEQNSISIGGDFKG